MVARARQLLPNLQLATCILVAGSALVSAPVTPAAASDDAVTIYRCTDAGGALALRDSPCLPGERQQVIEMQRPQDPPAQPQPEPPPAPTAVAAPAPPAVRTRVVVIQPPQPVYECVTADGERYTSDSPVGNPRWVPLWVLGFPARHVRHLQRPRYGQRPPDRTADNDFLHNDLVFDGIGRPAPDPPGDRPGAPQLPPAVGLALTPGTWIRDRCHRLPQAEVCSRLRDRHWELRREYNSALQSERELIDAEQRTIDARLATDC